jgi:hypothetical protein
VTLMAQYTDNQIIEIAMMDHFAKLTFEAEQGSKGSVVWTAMLEGGIEKFWYAKGGNLKEAMAALADEVRANP